MIITDLNYCKRCRKSNTIQNKNRTNYCSECAPKIGRYPYTRYWSSSNFINTSFEDAIEGKAWNGFKNIKYKKKLILQITKKFTNLQPILSDIKISNFKNISINQPYLYLVSDAQKDLLKVGQTVNPLHRFSCYYNISIHKPIKFHLFKVNSFEEQDLYEDKLRNYLEFLGYRLPKDNTNSRLKYI